MEVMPPGDILRPHAPIPLISMRVLWIMLEVYTSLGWSCLLGGSKGNLFCRANEFLGRNGASTPRNQILFTGNYSGDIVELK
jgi:hypothetical protein